MDHLETRCRVFLVTLITESTTKYGQNSKAHTRFSEITLFKALKI